MVTIQHLGYADSSIESPNKKHHMFWSYVREPPHGDGLFEITLNGDKVDGLFWGRNIIWDTESKYVIVDKFVGGSSAITIIFPINKCVISLVERAYVIKLYNDILEYKKYDSEVIESIDLHSIINKLPKSMI